MSATAMLVYAGALESVSERPWMAVRPTRITTGFDRNFRIYIDQLLCKKLLCKVGP